MQFRKKKRSSFKLLLSFILLLSILGGGYLYLSPSFEQNRPVVQCDDNIYWNLKSKLNIQIDDESGIKYYKIIFKDGQRDIVLDQKVLNEIQQSISLAITPPKLDMFYTGKDVTIEIEVVDNSKWNFLEGNKVVKHIQVKIDTKKPIANVLSNSRYVQRGGSALLVVNIEDENLKDTYISFNDKKRFKLLPFYKENYFVSLIAWPIDIEKFSGVNLVVIDKANNKTITKIPFYIQKKKIKIDDIKLSENFIKNISASVLEQSFEQTPTNLDEIFIYSNTHLRAKNIEMIEKAVRQTTSSELINNFDIKPFKRLRGSKTVAGYAERRHYYLNEIKINEAWHLGIDWASVKKAPVRVSNNGEVIFRDYLGLYGNTIIINHGMGLSSLYAHTSTQNVNIGDLVKPKQKIANTGSTGAVFGDHLHFGILIQGVEVNPIEWMDKNWIKTRITDILEDAKKQIDSK